MGTESNEVAHCSSSEPDDFNSLKGGWAALPRPRKEHATQEELAGT